MYEFYNSFFILMYSEVSVGWHTDENLVDPNVPF
jgi:hypothetical protein